MENDVLYNRIMNVVHEEYGPPGEGTKEITITENGTTTEDVRSYASAEITTAVPNSYTESDEGKVVDSGALVSQSSATYTENDTYDTTLINSVTVNVASSGGWTAEEIAQGLEPSGDIVLSVPANGKIIDYAFYKNSAITSIELTTYPNIYMYAFGGMTNLVRFSAPLCTGLGQKGLGSAKNLFSGCTKLESVYIPLVTGLGENCFISCTSLEIIDLPAVNSIGANYTFRDCSNLKDIVLRKSNVVSINGNSLNGTPFASGGTGGTLWVPESLVESYKTASNWVTMYNGGTLTIKSIESSATDPNAPIDLTQYYGDGTPIPTP